MKDYLYILPFKDKKHFKIGISSNSHSRIIHLDKIYDIDLENSFIVHSKKRNISILEKELLTIFEQDDVDNFSTEGHTEIRNVKYLNECLELIQNKHQNLNYKLEKLNLVQTDSQPIKKKPKVIKMRLKEISPLSFDYFMQSCEKLYHEAYCVERVVFKDSIKYLLKIDGSRFARQCTEFSFYVTNDTDKFKEMFNVGITGMVEDTRNDVAHLTITFPKIIEATHFTWEMNDYEYNSSTKLFFTLFKKTLEQIYFNQEFEKEMSFDEIVKQVEHEILNDFYQWEEMENFRKPTKHINDLKNGQSILDFNTCNLHGFPPNTKKKYSGLLNHWRNIGKEFNGHETFEFAFKQRVLPKESEWELSKFDKKQKLLNKYVLFNLFDYDSQFIVFSITSDSVFRLRSTDDGEFSCEFETDEQKKLIMKFVEKNFKTMTFDTLGEYLKSIGCKNIWGF